MFCLIDLRGISQSCKTFALLKFINPFLILEFVTLMKESILLGIRSLIVLMLE